MLNHRTFYDDGLYRDVRRGISLGCPLSPLMGALYLKALDERLEALGLFYARFMDDWVGLAPTQRKPHRALQILTQPKDEHTMIELAQALPTTAASVPAIKTSARPAQ